MGGRVAEVLDLAVSPNGDEFVSVGGDGSVLVWNASGETVAADIADSLAGSEARAVDWSDDGRWIALGTSGGGVIVWDVIAGRIETETQVGSDAIDSWRGRRVQRPSPAAM